VYRLINKNCDAILAELERINDVSRYLEIQSLLTEVDVSADTQFQRIYRAYWQMNVARLNDVFYERYFGLLESLKGAKITDVDRVVRQIVTPSNSTGRESLQFSFATKLVHTLDQRAPVYDRFVAAFYFFAAPSSGEAVDRRLGKLLAFYGFLRSEYARVIRDGLLEAAVRRFRDRFLVDEAFPDERIVDLLLWGFVSLLRSGVQQQGHALYE
jgi:hypothetical protein